MRLMWIFACDLKCVFDVFNMDICVLHANIYVLHFKCIFYAFNVDIYVLHFKCIFDVFNVDICSTFLFNSHSLLQL